MPDRSTASTSNSCSPRARRPRGCTATSRSTGPCTSPTTATCACTTSTPSAARSRATRCSGRTPSRGPCSTRTTEILVSGHNWPVFGRSEVRTFLAQQRDGIRYMHDQTLRLMSHGYVPSEIADVIEFPPSLARLWHLRGYYGTLKHNVRGIYAYYLGWYDGNPATLDPLPPRDDGEKDAGVHGWRGRRPRASRGGPRSGQLPLGRARSRPGDVGTSGTPRGTGARRGGPCRSSGTGRRTRRGATPTCLPPGSCATACRRATKNSPEPARRHQGHERAAGPECAERQAERFEGGRRTVRHQLEA